MTRDELNEQLVAYLYDELDEDERRELEVFLDANEDARQQLADLRRTRRVLGAWEDEAPPSEVTFVSEDASVGKKRLVIDFTWQRAAAVGFAIAAVLVLAFTRVDVSVNEGSMAVLMNWSDPTGSSASESDSVLTVDRFVEYQREYLGLTQGLIEASELRQRAAMIEFAGVLEARRQEDLREIGRGMQNVGQIAERGYLQSGALLTRLARSGKERGDTR